MRKSLLSGASIALLSLGAASLPGLADSPSTLADPIGDAPRLQLQLADSGQVPTGMLGAEPAQPPETVLIDELLDAEVIDIGGEDLASVDGVLVAPDGRLTHVVVSYGGFLGIGAKQVLLPWQRVSYNAALGTLRIPGNEADLEAAPGFVTQEELLDRQEAERATGAVSSPVGVPAPQQVQAPDRE